MNKLAKNNSVQSVSVHPQIVEIPVPLVVHESVSPLAAELLMKTAETLASNPMLYDQRVPYPQHDCGAPCCIIGHMRIHAGEAHSGSLYLDKIGLNDDQFERICYVNSWPDHIRRFGYEATPAQGIARIEHFLRTGE